MKGDSGIRVAIHGGSGAIDLERLGPERAGRRLDALRAIVGDTVDLLRAGASALDAVERAVMLLEDCEFFNAGRGSVLNAAGDVEMDAAIMDGRERRVGAVAAVRAVRNPVCAARCVMEHSAHVMLTAGGADAFAREHGLACEQPGYFVLKFRRQQLQRARGGDRVALDHDEAYGDRAVSTGDESGTVGAVARDAGGNLAAATSTGGMTNKLPGRVGDSPLVGAGVWADNRTCAVSTTGKGEFLMRAAVGADVHGRMRHGGQDLAHACRGALEAVRALGGHGGCIAADRVGTLVLEFNSTGMYRAWADGGGEIRAAILADEAA